MGLTTNYADDPILVGRFDSLAPAYSACGLPVCVAGVPAAPLCQTPILSPQRTQRSRSFRQNEHNFQNRGNGISEIEGKGAMGSAERGGSRASFNSFFGLHFVDSVLSLCAFVPLR
jgi:hypothetical protein